MIDDIGTYEKILMEMYPKAKIIPTNQDGKLREYENWFNLFIKVSQSSIYSWINFFRRLFRFDVTFVY